MRLFTLAAMAAGLVAAGSPVHSSESAASTSPIVLEHARVIPGDGSPAIEDASLLIDRGLVVSVGPAHAVRIPSGARRIDLTGKTVMPALVAGHGHVGYQRGVTFVRENYTKENIYNDLRRSAYWGIGTVMSMGVDPPLYVYEIREETYDGSAGVARLRTAGAGIGGPNTGPQQAAYSRGIAYEVTTAEEGRAAVRDIAPRRPDMVKMWIDPRGGRPPGPKIQPDVAKAIVDEARSLGLKVAVHPRDHVDVESAVSAGAFALVHMARDREMSDALVAEIASKGIYVTPTLSMAERNNYSGSVPAWFDEPALSALLNASVNPAALARLRQAFVTREPADALQGEKSYAFLHGTVRKLNAAGARIVLGGDTGLPDHFFGLAEHRELELLVDAGLTPMQAIVAGTSRAAEFVGLTNHGVLAAGKVADVLILDANPLEDIRNTRRISGLYIQGHEIDRQALAARLE
jgi:imidazolonepropionase-like amidohydrolase